MPVHQAIYGGYSLYAGALFGKPDFKDPNVFAAKLANNFMFGAQMGWFSMLGQNNTNQTTGEYHPERGIYEELMDTKHDPEIHYLRKLSSAKKVVNEYFLHGRVTRQLPLQSHLPPQSVQSIAWLSRDSNSMLVPITTVNRDGEYQIDMTLDLAKYGLLGDNKNLYNVRKISAYEGQESGTLGSYNQREVKINLKMAGREIVLLEIS